MLTFQRIEAEIRRFAEERPNTVYVGLKDLEMGTAGYTCFYDQGECSDGTVGCIVGQGILAAIAALEKEGEPLSEHQLAYIAEQMKEQTTAASLLSNIDITLEAHQRAWISRVQREQDRHKPWDIAVNGCNIAEVWEVS